MPNGPIVLPIEKFVPKFGGAWLVSGVQSFLKVRATAKRRSL